MEKHFVTFFSPGTFVAESTTKPIDEWNVDQAMKMAMTVKERHGAVPYGFQFSTRARGPDDLDSKLVKTSPMYYLGGRVETIDDVAKRNNPKESILLSNMRCNKWDRIVVNDSWTQPLRDGDIVLDMQRSPQPKAPRRVPPDS